MEPTEYALIVAGGSGTRMESSTPKQFLEVAGLPIVMHSLNRFISYSDRIQLTLVLPENQLIHWKQLCDQYRFEPEVRVVAGGDTRFQSVHNGLKQMPDQGLVAVHDGVRPFVTTEIIAASFQSAALQGCGIVAVRLADSIRQLAGNQSHAVARDDFRLIQTPQTFQLELIKKAYQQATNDRFTDDASVFEEAGFKVVLVEGSSENFKITNQSDLLRARAFAESDR